MGQFTQVQIFLMRCHHLEKYLDTMINKFIEGQGWIPKGGIYATKFECWFLVNKETSSTNQGNDYMCYREKLPMAWGVPQQTDKPQKSILYHMQEKPNI